MAFKSDHREDCRCADCGLKKMRLGRSRLMERPLASHPSFASAGLGDTSDEEDFSSDEEDFSSDVSDDYLGVDDTTTDETDTTTDETDTTTDETDTTTDETDTTTDETDTTTDETDTTTDETDTTTDETDTTTDETDTSDESASSDEEEMTEEEEDSRAESFSWTDALKVAASTGKDAFTIYREAKEDYQAAKGLLQQAGIIPKTVVPQKTVFAPKTSVPKTGASSSSLVQAGEGSSQPWMMYLLGAGVAVAALYFVTRSKKK